MNCLLDTDEIIDYLKGKPKSIQTIDKLFDSAQKIFISVISIAEYQHGAYASSRLQTELDLLNTFLRLANVKILDVTQEIAEAYGKIQGDLQKKGQIGGAFDMLIAATCLVYNLTLITGNKKDFIKVKDLKLFDG